MIIQEGDQFLVCHRRLYEQDEPRFFVGKVIASNDTVMKINGFSFGRDPNTGHMVRKDELRTKLISIIAGTHLLYQLADDVSVEDLRLVQEKGQLLLTDHVEFQMDLSDYHQSRRI